jgi:hypothetical protein
MRTDKTIKIIAIALSVLALGIAMEGVSQSQQSNLGKKPSIEKIDLELDEGTATQIAEIVLVHVYGNKVLEQRPWNVTKTNSTFKFEGTLPKPKIDAAESTIVTVKGGVAELEIDRINAAIISISHGK